MDQLRESDPLQEAYTAVALAWRDALGIGSKLRVQQIIERANLIQEAKRLACGRRRTETAGLH
jgi:hypothetical protein